MADELIDIYDDNFAPLGTELKSVAHRAELWHRSIHCWVVRRTADPDGADGADGGGTVLFQRRSAGKDLFPGLLDISAAGHYRAGEAVADGVREIAEELGVDVAFEQLAYLGVRTSASADGAIVHREFCETFLLRRDAAPHEYAPDPDEVEGLVEISVPDGLRLFSGRASTATARGVEYRQGPEGGDGSGFWAPVETPVAASDFVPTVDPCYYKVFILADLMLRGYEHLAI